MQSTVQFFDVPAMANRAGLSSQKVAVKLSAQDAATPQEVSSDFAAVMAALMHLPADKLNQSLRQFDWVPVEAGAKEWVPLIDLTTPEGKDSNMIQMLLNASQAEPGTTTFFQKNMMQCNATDPSFETPTQAQANAQLLSGTLQADPLAADGELNSSTIATQAFFAGNKITPGTEENNSASTAAISPIIVGQNPRKEMVDPTFLQAEQNVIVLQEATILKRSSKWIAEPVLSKASVPVDMPKPNAPVELTTLNAQTDFAKANAQHPLYGIGNRILASQKAVPVDEKKTGNISGAKSAATIKPVLNQTFSGPLASDSETSLDGVNVKSALDDALTGAFTKQRSEAKAQTENTIGVLTEQSSGTNAGVTSTLVLPSGGSSTTDAQWKEIGAKQMANSNNGSEAPADSKDLQNDVIHQIVQRMTMRSDGRQSHMQIKLKPEFLGQMRVEISTENQQVMVRMAAESQKVKEIIEQNLHVLKSELQQHGLQVQKIDVYVSQDNDTWKNSQQQALSQNAHDRGQRQAGSRGASLPASEEADTVDGAVTLNRDYSDKSAVDFFA